MFINQNYLRVFQEENKEGGEGNEPTLEQVQAQLAESQKNNESMKAKMDELLSETKKAKKLKADAELLAKEEAESKAKASGDFEQLLKSSEQTREKLQNDYESLVNSNNYEKINSAALKLARELADGYNAEILSESIAKRLKMSDGVLKVTDESGALTVSSLEELKTTFKSNDKYRSLLKGNQSSGGGANGGSKGGGAANNNLTSTQRIAEGLKDL